MRTAKQAAFMGVTPVPGVERRLIGLDVKQNKMRERSGFRRSDDLRDDGFGGYDVEPCQRIVGTRHCGATASNGISGPAGVRAMWGAETPMKTTPGGTRSLSHPQSGPKPKRTLKRWT